MRNMSLGLATLIIVAIAAPAYGQCTCSVAKVDNGWCSDCKVGYFDAVKVKSKTLFKALDGEAVDVSAVSCSSCKKAIASDGFCAACNLGFVGKQKYSSKVAYELAKGDSKDPAKIACTTRRKNSDKSGWCDSCKVGMVGNVAYKDKADYKKAVNAREIVLAAAKSKCETCAVAMVTDGTCAACKVAYKDGKKTKLKQP